MYKYIYLNIGIYIYTYICIYLNIVCICIFSRLSYDGFYKIKVKIFLKLIVSRHTYFLLSENAEHKK